MSRCERVSRQENRGQPYAWASTAGATFVSDAGDAYRWQKEEKNIHSWHGETRGPEYYSR